MCKMKDKPRPLCHDKGDGKAGDRLVELAGIEPATS
jgi:hypothetical protein